MDLVALYRDIVEESPDGIWVIDLDGHTVFANTAMATMLHLTPEQLADSGHGDMLDELGRGQFVEHLKQIRLGELFPEPVEVQYVRADGSLLWVLVSQKVLLDGHGRPSAILMRNTDYTERHLTIDRLVESERRLAEAHRIARIGAWTWDVPGDRMTASPELLALYGLPPDGGATTFAGFLGTVHRDDREELLSSLKTVFDGADHFVFMARFRSALSSWVWVRGRGTATRDASGRVTLLSGTHQDITEAKRAELALVGSVRENALLRAVASAANQASSLNEALVLARSIVLRSQDLDRARAFMPTGEDGQLEPMYVLEADRVEDLDEPARARADLALATRSWALRRTVWDEPHSMVAFTVPAVEEVQVVIIVSGPALTRQPKAVESLVEVASTQLEQVAQRERAGQELEEARDEARHASQLKSGFLATMSHEIRTPLNGVIGLNDLLLRTRLDEEQQRLAAGVHTASRALLSVINDILDFSKIEAGQLVLEHVDFAIDDVLDQIEMVLGESARAKGLRLRFRMADDVPPVVNGDPTRLLQVLANLVSNAVKFTEAGHVQIEIEPLALQPAGGLGLQMSVSDTGIGVDPGQAESLFAPFAQADASTTRVYGGTGLGLAIAREIVEAFGGELAYAPRPGGGSTFTFTAHLARPTADGTGLTPDGEGGLSAGGAVTSDPAAETGPHREQRVLVVEDNAVNQMVATGLLTALGYVVEVVEDGLAALDAVEVTAFDAILMDVQMPRLDGYATTRAIRRGSSINRGVPIIAMTAAAIDGERERCLEAGMDDFLTKPVDPVSMAAVLAEWVDTVEGLDEAVDAEPQATSSLQDLPVDRPVEIPGDLAEALEAPDWEAVRAELDPDGPPRIAHLDVDRLEMLREMDPHDTSYLDRAIDNFITNSLEACTSMRAAIEADDVTALRHTAHKLVGGALNLGVSEGGEAVRRIEWVADTGSTHGAADLLPAAERSLAQGRSALAAYRQWYASLRAPSSS